MLPTSNSQFEFMRPLVTGWLGKIELAARARKSFDDVAEQCTAFFSSDLGFMWDAQFQAKFLKGRLSPRFKITMNKAFELVALFGPTLYWQNPQRSVRPRRPIEISPEVFGPMGDQMAQLIFEHSQQEQEQRYAIDNTRCHLMERYLNYTPGEMPGGGLAKHSTDAITEALVKGRGLLWVKPYELPGSSRVLTGCFYDTVDNFYVDPDAESLHEAKWIAQRCVHPVWQVEREYNLPPGSLERKGNLESAWSQGERQGHDMSAMHRRQGLTFDLMVYYKIWSKGGAGARLTGVTTALKDALDNVAGDYAYLVIAPNVPYPLNAPTERLRSAYDQDVARMFQWPVPYWRDDRWPVVELDFYRKPRSAWPIAPMAPGLGELVFMNVIVSHLANRIWSSSRDIIAVLQSAAKDVKDKILKGEDLTVLELSDVQKSINDVVSFLQHPELRQDAWNILDRVSENFDRRVGLSELLYGLNPGGVASRSAADMQAKREAASVRPEYMSRCVEDWQSEAARLEKLCARWFIEPADVRPLVGNTGAYLWERLINNESPELVVREMDATVEAGSAKKPNKDRDVGNLNAVMPSLFPELSKHADVTGDTGPINNLITEWGEAIEQDMSAVHMGPRVPQPPPPEEQQAAQQEQEHAQQQHEMELQSKQADMQMRQEEQQMQLQQRQLELQFDQQRHHQEMEQDQEQFQQEMQQEALKALLGIQQTEAEGQARMQQQRQQGQLQIQQTKQQGQIQAQQARQQGDLKVQQAKAMAKAKPKPAGGSAGKSTKGGRGA